MTWLYAPAAQTTGLSVEQVGGKALGLYWLQSHGFSAPPTWVLSTRAFDVMVEAMGATGWIAKLARATAGGPDWAAAELALRELSALGQKLYRAFMHTPLPQGVAEALRALPQNVSHWAVRSSATVEDGSTHSFAGHFTSCLFVPRGPKLIKAVREVWASTFDKRVLHYRAQHGTPVPRMAVILQPMSAITERDRAGVAFSESPIPGLEGVLIQVTFGAGVTVVGGEGGELKCVNGAQVTTHSQAPAHIMVTARDEGLRPALARSRHVLTDTEAFQLAVLVCEIESRYGRPVDVEFVWRAGQEPVFVQMRKLTG
jgi:pyruvate,water dikinase